jgi:hypothetical protein
MEEAVGAWNESALSPVPTSAGPSSEQEQTRVAEGTVGRRGRRDRYARRDDETASKEVRGWRRGWAGHDE